MAGLWDRIGRTGRAVALLAVGLTGGAAAVAVAAIPDSNGVIHGCYAVNGNGVPLTSGANLRIIDPSAGQTCATTGVGAPASERALDWNQSGPAGPTGAAGPAGQNGSSGAPGQSGPQGPAVTVAGGHTLTLTGGQVITVGGGAPGVTINNPPPNLGRSVGHVTLGTGTQALNFDIAELNFATGAHGSGGGGGAGKVSVHDISITKHVDKASALLLKACANGQHYKTVTITMRKAGGTQYLKITLTNVLISSYQTGGSGHSAQPTESLSLNFTKVEYQYSK